MMYEKLIKYSPKEYFASRAYYRTTVRLNLLKNEFIECVEIVVF